MTLYPLKFRPIFKPRIWGGTALHSFFGKPIPAGRKIGESWELSDLPDNHSEIINGPLAGQTIDNVIKQYRGDITGPIDWQQPFPLLIKILDAADTLSVQVHPDQAVCNKMNTGAPKTECWYIIDARPGAFIYKGLKPGTTADQFRASIQNGTCESFLVKVPVQPGECHFLPSGTCHAIGAGLLIAEIQQPSDTTYRVFDWNRLDADTGKPRQLHVEQALQSIHFDQSNDKLSVHTSGRLVDSDEFKVDKIECGAQCNLNINPGIMRVVVVLSGAGRFVLSDGSEVAFAKGDTLLIPAVCQTKAVFGDKTEMLIAAV